MSSRASRPIPQDVELSVIIPAYNEQRLLHTTVRRVAEYLAARGEVFEIIVVDDGSTDATAVVAARALNALGDRGHLIQMGRNQGKGAAVRRGMLAARGARVLFSDADLSTPIEEVEKLERALDQGASIAIGSRALDRSLIAGPQPHWRDLSGRFFNLFAQALVVRGLWDTQCGFKLFLGDVVEIVLAPQRISGFAFDVEIMAIARRLGLVVTEVPVRWTNCPDTRVTLRSALRAFVDLVHVRLNVMRGRYDARGAAPECTPPVRAGLDDRAGAISRSGESPTPPARARPGQGSPSPRRRPA